ncbi:AraC family transcriptional regulator [Pseudonocardia sp. TRM90224]|uniref:AraC family transcriptional regulator n=1 Tax=Pseudonocardia sp. TRM90224 TaxID=2812678 RepID=UPI001E5E02E9|nr:AraC family transcriptional regulator [Pseudonocardia sp. TRM90224]
MTGPPSAELGLDEPVEVVQIGNSVHGVHLAHAAWSLPHLWQLHLYRYSCEASIDGHPLTIKPGSVSVWPAGSAVEQRFQGRSEHIYVHFRPRSRANPRTFPVLQHAGEQTVWLDELLRHAVTAPVSDRSRVEADVWSVLCRIADPQLSRPSPTDTVTDAIAFIAAHLTEPIRVPLVAAAAGVSHNHLTRQFRATTGLTVVAYIRRQRLLRARHLLASSTMSITSVASAVGIPDIQAFNRACRLEFGVPPRSIRTDAERSAPVTMDDRGAPIGTYLGGQRRFVPGADVELPATDS